jgi:integrase
MVCDGCSRKTVNKYISCIKRMYGWAAKPEQEYVSADVSVAIRAVESLVQNRSEAKELPRVEAVPDDVIVKTLAELQPETADMIRVARLCGCRPSEQVNLNGGEIDRRDAECWWYRPRHHKNAHRHHPRAIPLNRDAQAILAPYLLAAGSGKLFHFRTRNGLHQAIERACKRAFPHPEICKIPPRKRTPGQRAELQDWDRQHRWTTNQLRHAALQEAKDIDGHDGSQALGGHRHASTTDTYATATERRAKEVALKMTLPTTERREAM